MLQTFTINHTWFTFDVSFKSYGSKAMHFLYYEWTLPF
jgi:hypothetical protein